MSEQSSQKLLLVLNGASSAGKTSLCKELQRTADTGFYTRSGGFDW